MKTIPSADVSAADRARTLLENIRRTPMLRGGRLLERRRLLKAHIESAMIDQGVPERLAARIASQLVLKCPSPHLGDGPVWDAIAKQVRGEVDQLRQRLGLTDRLLTVGVPKLSADDIERLFEDMRRVDPRYGRTLAEAALDGAEPWAMARRYGKAFTAAVRRLSSKNPRNCPHAGRGGLPEPASPRERAGVPQSLRHARPGIRGQRGLRADCRQGGVYCSRPSARCASVRPRLPGGRAGIDRTSDRTIDRTLIGRNRRSLWRSLEHRTHAGGEVP